MEENKNTAQEVPVQEQYKAKVSFDKNLLREKLDRIDFLTSELRKEVNSIPETLKVELLK